MAASLREITVQIVGLLEANEDLLQKVRDLEQQVAEGAGGRAGGAFAGQRHGLVDQKKLFPDALTRDEDFREWRDDFVEWVEFLEPAVAKRLEEVAILDEEQDLDPHETEAQAHVRRSLYAAMRKLIKTVEGKLIAKSVKEHNPFEAFRLLRSGTMP